MEFVKRFAFRSFGCVLCELETMGPVWFDELPIAYMVLFHNCVKVTGDKSFVSHSWIFTRGFAVVIEFFWPGQSNSCFPN